MSPTGTSCKLEVDRGPDWLIIKIWGFDAEAAASSNLADQLWKLAQEHFTYRIVLELDQVPLLNSDLLGQLIRLSKQVQEHDGVLRLCGLSAHNRRVLRGCALEDHFTAYENRNEAVLGGADPRLPR